MLDDQIMSNLNTPKFNSFEF